MGVSGSRSRGIQAKIVLTSPNHWKSMASLQIGPPGGLGCKVFRAFGRFPRSPVKFFRHRAGLGARAGLGCAAVPWRNGAIRRISVALRRVLNFLDPLLGGGAPVIEGDDALGWSRQVRMVCYPEDLWVEPSARRAVMGRILIETLVAGGKQRARLASTLLAHRG